MNIIYTGLLFGAVQRGDIDFVRHLTEEIEPNVSLNGITPLLLASKKGNADIVRLLLKKKADINVTDQDGDTALHNAVRDENFKMCKILVEHEADINIQNNKMLTPIMIAAAAGIEDILKYLVGQPKAKLNLGDSDKDTALHIAIFKSQISSVNVLLQYGADAKALNGNMLTPFHIAALLGNEKILELFLERKAASLVDIKDQNGFSAMHLVVLRNNQGCLKLLLKYKADKNIVNKSLETPLHIAVKRGHFECVKILVESEAEINITDKDGDTPIHLAIFLHSCKLIKKKILLDERLNFLSNLKMNDSNLLDIILYLVNKGALSNVQNNKGQTPAELCVDEVLKRYILAIQEMRERNIKTPHSEDFQMLLTIMIEKRQE